MMILLIFNVSNNAFTIFVVNGKHGVSGLPVEMLREGASTRVFDEGNSRCVLINRSKNPRNDSCPRYNDPRNVCCSFRACSTLRKILGSRYLVTKTKCRTSRLRDDGFIVQK